MRLGVVALWAVVVASGCKDDPACVAHVECGEGLRCIEGACQAGEAPEPEAPEPEAPGPEMPEPEAPGPEMPEPEAPGPEMPEPEPPADMGADDGTPDMTPPDMDLPDVPPGGPDRALFNQTIEPILRGRCSSCHPTDATPGDGRFNVDNSMFGNMYAEVQEFINVGLPEQSDLVRKPTGAGHPMIWAVGDADYTQVVNWIRTGQ